MTRPLVILDRDGVINEDSPDFIKSVAEWIPIPGSLDAIARLKHAGFAVAVATNQSGLARGLLTTADLDAMNARLEALLRERGCGLARIAWCPHGPDDGCDCRKPRPGMLEQLAHHFDTSLAGVPVIGDSLRDLDRPHAARPR